MMLFDDWILEFVVGGERMEMSRAVPRRSGTRGVSSNATRGRNDASEDRVEPFPSRLEGAVCGLMGSEWAGLISYASIRPGVMTMLHSSGCRGVQWPAFDQVKMDAIVRAALLA